MTTASLRFDMRAPEFGAPATTLYQAAIEMAEYADRHGFEAIVLSEHHGIADGYLPSPLVLAAAMAARTKRIRFEFMALVPPLHDPLRLAEDIAVLDQVSQGRVTVCLVGGYVPGEFAMFGRDPGGRADAMEEAVATLKAAASGESFEFRGRRVRVTPRPVQRPHPPVLLGGSSKAAARRAGRMADGFVTYRPDLYQVYFDEARAQGKAPAPFSTPAPGFLYVAEDPEAAWRVIGPHAVHEMNSYGEWIAATGADGRFARVETTEDARASGGYAVLTPEDCIDFARPFRNLVLPPLLAGLAPEFGWTGLRLFTERVLPFI